MDNLNMNNQAKQGRPGSLNGQEGSWVPVDPNAVSFSVSQDINNPSMAPDGSYYYAEGGNMSNNGYGQIAANYNNAIPTPSQIVQLPPIVQPIALVPYASQNQPLLQYDPNVRPAVQTTAQEPIYRSRAYSGLSVLLVLLAVAVCVVAALLKSIIATSSITAIDSIMGLGVLFNLGGIESVYHTEVLKAAFASGIMESFKTNLAVALFAFLIPVLFALTIIIALILVIYYLVKLGKRKNPAGFNILTLIGFILAVGNVVVMVMAKDIAQDMGAYVIAAVFLILLILPLFAKKDAQVLDYAASKRTYLQE